MEGKRDWVAIVACVAAWAAVAVGWYVGSKQQDDNRELIKVQVGLELIKQFDSPEMLLARKKLAQDLIAKRPLRSWRVIDFLDMLGAYNDKKEIDDDLIYENFSYYIKYYWPAVKASVENFRKDHGGDNEYSEHMEALNDKMALEEATLRKRAVSAIAPTPAEVENFLKEEAAGQ